MSGTKQVQNGPINYFARLAPVIGGVTATILLQQIIYWHGKKEGRFYKYRTPCDKSRPGDSWCEELGFSPGEFDGARKKISTKLNKEKGITVATVFDMSQMPQICEWLSIGKYLKNLQEEGFMKKLVAYWTTQDHKTYYTFNQPLFDLLFDIAYADKSPVQDFPNREKWNQLIRILQSESISENTAENTKDIGSKQVATDGKPLMTDTGHKCVVCQVDLSLWPLMYYCPDCTTWLLTLERAPGDRLEDFEDKLQSIIDGCPTMQAHGACAARDDNVLSCIECEWQDEIPTIEDINKSTGVDAPCGGMYGACQNIDNKGHLMDWTICDSCEYGHAGNTTFRCCKCGKSGNHGDEYLNTGDGIAHVRCLDKGTKGDVTLTMVEAGNALFGNPDSEASPGEFGGEQPITNCKTLEFTEQHHRMLAIGYVKVRIPISGKSTNTPNLPALKQLASAELIYKHKNWTHYKLTKSGSELCQNALDSGTGALFDAIKSQQVSIQTKTDKIAKNGDKRKKSGSKKQKQYPDELRPEIREYAEKVCELLYEKSYKYTTQETRAMVVTAAWSFKRAGHGVEAINISNNYHIEMGWKGYGPLSLVKHLDAALAAQNRNQNHIEQEFRME